MSVIDISRAYFNAVRSTDKPKYVELPEEAGGRSSGLVGRLNAYPCGTQDAAEGWHDEYANFLTDVLGFTKGDASACVFRHAARGITTSVYGDDFTTAGSKEALDWFKQRMEQKYELVESARLGPAQVSFHLNFGC